MLSTRTKEKYSYTISCLKRHISFKVLAGKQKNSVKGLFIEVCAEVKTQQGMLMWPGTGNYGKPKSFPGLKWVREEILVFWICIYILWTEEYSQKHRMKTESREGNILTFCLLFSCLELSLGKPSRKLVGEDLVNAV